MNKADQKELRKIQTRVFEKYRPQLYKKQPRGDVMLEVVDKCLNEERDRFSDDHLEKLQAIKDSKILEGEETVVDERVERVMEREMEREIKKAIKEGRLTHPKDDPDYQKLVKKYGKRS